jgi:hypothetical protein
MAMHILRGEFPIFQWGYNYMGTLESFVAAPIMLIFGPTRFAIALSPTLFSMLFACAAYLFARELLAVTFPVIYLASPFSGPNTQRYLIPLYTVLTLAPAFLVHDLGRSRRFPAAVLGCTLVALYAIPTIRGTKILNSEALRVYRQERAQEQRLLAALEHLGLNAVYVDSYWDAARFTFDASERIFFATPFSDRIHEHLDFVDGAEHPAFLFHYPAHTPAFEGTLRLASARYRKRVVAGFILYSAIESLPGDGAEIPVVAASASQNSVDAPPRGRPRRRHTMGTADSPAARHMVLSRSRT